MFSSATGEVGVLHDLFLVGIDGAVVDIEHRVALKFAVGHFLLVRHAVVLGELTAFFVVDAEVAFALDLFTHEGDGVDVDLATFVSQIRLQVHDGLLFEVFTRDGDDNVEANIAIFAFLQRVGINAIGDLLRLAGHSLDVARIVEFVTETQVELAVHILVVDDVLVFLALDLGHLVEIVGASEEVGVIQEDVELGGHVESDLHTGRNREAQIALASGFGQSGSFSVVVAIEVLNGIGLVVDTTDTDVRHQVDDSSRVVLEHVEQVEGQVQVAFNVVRLVKAEVVTSVVGSAVQHKGLVVLVTGIGAVAALEVQANDFTELVTNAKVGIPVGLESHGLKVVEVIPNTTVVVGQIAVVDGETTVGLNVPVSLNRFLVVTFLGNHAERKESHDDEHQQLRNSQVFLHNAIVLGL